MIAIAVTIMAAYMSKTSGSEDGTTTLIGNANCKAKNWELLRFVLTSVNVREGITDRISSTPNPTPSNKPVTDTISCSHVKTLATCLEVVPSARKVTKLVRRVRTLNHEVSTSPTSAARSAV